MMQHFFKNNNSCCHAYCNLENLKNENEDALIIQKKNEDTTEFVLSFDGCCRWSVVPLKLWEGRTKQQDCPHYSSQGCATHHQPCKQFTEPLEFIATFQDLMKTFERYENEKSFTKLICTVSAWNYNKNFSDNGATCSEGRGYVI